MIPDFGDIDTSNPNCVVMGDAAECFHYNFLNECFRKLMGMENPILFTLGQGYENYILYYWPSKIFHILF